MAVIELLLSRKYLNLNLPQKSVFCWRTVKILQFISQNRGIFLSTSPVGALIRQILEPCHGGERPGLIMGL